MTRGKKAAQAANRRAYANGEVVADARREVAEVKAQMLAAEVRHRAEMQLRSLDHLAHLDALVDERYGQLIEQAVADAVAVRVEAVRSEARREFFVAIKGMLDRSLIGISSATVPEAIRELSKAAGFDVTGVMGMGDSRYIRRMREHNPRQMAALINDINRTKLPVQR